MLRGIWRSFASIFRPHQKLISPRDAWMKKSIRTETENIIRHFEKEEFTEIHRRLNFIIRLLLPELLLRKGWKLVQLFAGPIVHAGPPEISLGWMTDTASVPIQFRRSKLNLRLSLTKSGGIIGLRFLPQDLTFLGLGRSDTIWRAPLYVSATDFGETEMVLGSSGNAVRGTLTLPRAVNRSPCVILLGGSGPCDQDSTVQAAKPFKDLAIGLASQGIATLRFDKVTVAHGRRLSKKSDLTLTDEYVEHATDAVNQASYHPKINPGHIYLAGHSLGSVITPKLASSLSAIRGYILLAPPAQPLYWSAIRQLEYLSQLQSNDNGTAPEDLEDKGLESLRQAALLADSSLLTIATPAEDLPFGIGPHYWLDYRTFTPVETTQETTKPVLILQGEKDYQVTMKDDYAHWQDALRDRRGNVKMLSYANLNHLFMICDGVSKPSDYEKQCNVDFEVIRDITRWIHEHE